jgi:hypothetical protein
MNATLKRLDSTFLVQQSSENDAAKRLISLSRRLRFWKISTKLGMIKTGELQAHLAIEPSRTSLFDSRHGIDRKV